MLTHLENQKATASAERPGGIAAREGDGKGLEKLDKPKLDRLAISNK